MRNPTSPLHNLVSICCYFNPCHYAIRRHNYRLFRESMARSDIRLFTVELAFGDDPFELPQSPDVLQIRGRDIMWQKERLLQIGAEYLADDGYDGFVFIDADTIFENSDWPSEVAKRLDDHPVVQCFSQVDAYYTDAQFTIDSGIKMYSETGRLEGRVGHVWAMRSEVVFQAGLYQHCVVGGGDSVQFIAAIGNANDEDAWLGKLAPHDFIREYGPTFLGHYQDWANRFIAATQGDVGYADLKITALCHGSLKDRSYEARHGLLTSFDPLREVTHNPGAPFEWTRRGTRLRDPVREYFFRRNEDGGEYPEPGTDLRTAELAWQPTRNTDIIRGLQIMLCELNFDPGPADGRMGPSTQRAILAYQLVHGLARTGAPSDDLFAHMHEQKPK